MRNTIVELYIVRPFFFLSALLRTASYRKGVSREKEILKKEKQTAVDEKDQNAQVNQNPTQK
jgi:hypothetical protein